MLVDQQADGSWRNRSILPFDALRKPPYFDIMDTIREKGDCVIMFKRVRALLCLLCVISLIVPSISGKAATKFTNGILHFQLVYEDDPSQVVIIGFEEDNLPSDLQIRGSYNYTDGITSSVYGINSKVFQNQSFSSIQVEAGEGYLIGSYALAGVTVEGTGTVTFDSLGIAAIGSHAFEEMVTDGDVTIDGMNGSINNFAFQNAQIGGTLAIKGNIDTIGEYAFAGLSAKGFTLSPTVKKIDDYAFSNTKLVHAVLPTELETLGSNVFDGCEMLSSITLSAGDAVETAAVDAFPDREGVTIVIPETCTDISVYQFNQYTNLVYQTAENISKDSPVIQYLQQNNLTYKIGEDGELVTPSETPNPTVAPTAVPTVSPTPTPVVTVAPMVSPTAAPTTEPIATTEPTVTPTTTPAVTEVPTQTAEPTATPVVTAEPTGIPTAPPTLTPSPATYTLRGIKYQITGKNQVAVLGTTSKKLKKLTIPDTVTIDGRLYKVVKIKKKAFANQKKLKKVVLGTFVKDVEQQAFANCKKLTTFEFSMNIKSIGKKAFYKDKKLKRIVLKGKKLKKIGKKAFEGISPKVKIIVAKSCAKRYKKLIAASK